MSVLLDVIHSTKYRAPQQKKGSSFEIAAEGQANIQARIQGVQHDECSHVLGKKRPCAVWTTYSRHEHSTVSPRIKKERPETVQASSQRSCYSTGSSSLKPLPSHSSLFEELKQLIPCYHQKVCSPNYASSPKISTNAQNAHEVLKADFGETNPTTTPTTPPLTLLEASLCEDMAEFSQQLPNFSFDSILVANDIASNLRRATNIDTKQVQPLRPRHPLVANVANGCPSHEVGLVDSIEAGFSFCHSQESVKSVFQGSLDSTAIGASRELHYKRQLTSHVSTPFSADGTSANAGWLGFPAQACFFEQLTMNTSRGNISIPGWQSRISENKGVCGGFASDFSRNIFSDDIPPGYLFSDYVQHASRMREQFSGGSIAARGTRGNHLNHAAVLSHVMHKHNCCAAHQSRQHMRIELGIMLHRPTTHYCKD